MHFISKFELCTNEFSLRNAGFAQRIPTLCKKLRNAGIACQSTDSYFAQRNPKFAQLPGLNGTYIVRCKKVTSAAETSKKRSIG